MEDILKLHEKPFDAKEPVVCLDEKAVILREDKRKPRPPQVGKIAKRDHQYTRRGMVNTFIAIEPKTGFCISSVTKRRTGADYAKYLRLLLEKYPHAKTIHLVQDNLSTHTMKSLTSYYGLTEGRKMWERFSVHYTPKHGSWLNQAEIIISIYSRQCLGNSRIPSIEALRARTKKWTRQVNLLKQIINWSFTRKKARKKFNYSFSRKGVLFTKFEH